MKNISLNKKVEFQECQEMMELQRLICKKSILWVQSMIQLYNRRALISDTLLKNNINFN